MAREFLSIRNEIDTWEYDIKYYENYLYDNQLIVGEYYKIVDGKIISEKSDISDETKLALKTLLWDKLSNSGMADTTQFQDAVSDWAELLNQPIQIKVFKNKRYYTLSITKIDFAEKNIEYS